MKRPFLIWTISAFLLGISALSSGASEQQSSEAQAGADNPYDVRCEETDGVRHCKVDRETYVGWRTYHSNCHVCHGQDAVGSSFAPSLVERLKVISHQRFLVVLAGGYEGQLGVMPGWGDNPNVNTRFPELYAYLKARADGVLPPGRPERFDR